MWSLLSKLTGSVSPEDYDDLFDETEHTQKTDPTQSKNETQAKNDAQKALTQIGELSVDVFQTPNDIVVKALVAGIQPTNINIDLTRDMITISGTREEHREVEECDYVQKELFWGGFSRTIILPEEVDPDTADASILHGILIIRLPKINKDKKTKVKVRAR